jgi:hypothetical protein
MNRRGFLAGLAALPLVGRLMPESLMVPLRDYLAQPAVPFGIKHNPFVVRIYDDLHVDRDWQMSVADWQDYWARRRERELAESLFAGYTPADCPPLPARAADR